MSPGCLIPALFEKAFPALSRAASEPLGRVVAEIRSGQILTMRSGYHRMRCLPFFICLGCWSLAYSNRAASLKSRTSFFDISSISPEACAPASACAVWMT